MLVYDGTSDIYPTTQRFRTHLGMGMRRLFTELRIACECTAYTDEDHFENMENTWLYKRLPPAVALQLDEPFIENLMASHLSLAFKTFTPEPAGVACLAETFLLVWSTEWAVFLNHSSDTLQSDCDTFIGAAIGDFDHEFLDAPQAPMASTSLRILAWLHRQRSNGSNRSTDSKISRTLSHGPMTNIISLKIGTI